MATRALCFVGLLLCLLQLFQQAAADTYGRATYYWDNNQVIISCVDAGGGHPMIAGGTGNSLTMHSTAVCPPMHCCLCLHTAACLQGSCHFKDVGSLKWYAAYPGMTAWLLGPLHECAGLGQSYCRSVHHSLGSSCTKAFLLSSQIAMHCRGALGWAVVDQHGSTGLWV